MKNEKVFFYLAGVALIGAFICFLSLFFTSEQTDPEEVEKVESETQEESMQKEAEEEILRFRKSYGIDITMEEMLKEIRIRRDYEKKYGRSYNLEEVFLADIPEDNTQGDPGDEEYSDTIEKIQEYIRLYDIDESRYEAMTAKEELDALEVEYGPLITEENTVDEPHIEDGDLMTEQTTEKPQNTQEDKTEISGENPEDATGE